MTELMEIIVSHTRFLTHLIIVIKVHNYKEEQSIEHEQELQLS